jgi:pimeloyl-ACP methyl ester carboxylesterase
MKTADGTAYQSDGPEDAPAVILIHGLGLCREIWIPFIEALTPRYRVISYDLYGHGKSGPAPEPPSLCLFARQINLLMMHCKIADADIIGFSIGGMINRRLAMDFPDRCRSLVILNAPHERDSEAQAQVELRAVKVKKEGKMTTLPAALERWFTPSFRETGSKTLDDVTMWRSVTDEESYAGAAWVLAHGVVELIKPNPPLTIPCMIITTENDSGSTPQMSTAIGEEIAGSHVLIIPALRHLGLIEQPQLFIDPVLSFLADPDLFLKRKMS